MKIVACGPPSDKPYIPKMAILEDGSKVFKDNSLDCETEQLITSFELPDKHWFAVLSDGLTETFPVEKTKEWTANKATEIVSNTMNQSGDPLKRLANISAAAALIGISISELLSALSHFKNSVDDSLYEAFVRMQEKGGKIP